MEYLAAAFLVGLVLVGIAVIRRTRGRVRWLVVLVVVSWLGIGLVRSGTIAREYFARAHGEGARVVNVDVPIVAPAIPPIWVVNISGDVIEAGRTSPVYRSYMLLCVEPITGVVFECGAG